MNKYKQISKKNKTKENFGFYEHLAKTIFKKARIQGLSGAQGAQNRKQLKKSGNFIRIPGPDRTRNIGLPSPLSSNKVNEPAHMIWMRNGYDMDMTWI